MTFLVISLVALSSAVALGDGALPLEGPTWLLVEIQGTVVEIPAGERQPSLTLNKALKRATGYSGCNEFFGSYELKGGALVFGLFGMTRKFCEGAVGDRELAFMRTLGETRAWKMEKGLLLLINGGTVLARLKPAPHGR
jgi:heat shock protein HslJ